MEINIEDLVMVTKDRLNKFLDAELRLNCLEAMGVDNWDGYNYAMEMYETEKKEDGDRG